MHRIENADAGWDADRFREISKFCCKMTGNGEIRDIAYGLTSRTGDGSKIPPSKIELQMELKPKG